MASKISAADRLQYLVDKVSQLNVTLQEVEDITYVPVSTLNDFILGKREIEDKTWVQLGLGLSKLAKKLGVPTEKEEKVNTHTKRRTSRTSIIRQVEELDFFNE